MGSARSTLEEVYNEIVGANVDINLFPANSKFRKYYEYKTNPDRRKLPPGSAQLQNGKRLVGIRPFGMDFSDDTKTLIRMSNRAFTALGSINPNDVLKIETTTAGYTKEAGFRPAKAHIATKLSNGVAVLGTNNRVTGRPYRKYVGETYAAPYGRGASTDNEIDRQDVILLALDATHTVTFTPEHLSRRT